MIAQGNFFDTSDTAEAMPDLKPDCQNNQRPQPKTNKTLKPRLRFNIEQINLCLAFTS